MGLPEEKKTHHPVTFQIPIKTWDKIERLLVIEKQNRDDRKLNKADLLVELIEKGLTE